ncbi:hypothetical protein GLYMA_09G275200v4 [Glycine max]|uniref:Uncharacterized protein n=1 Tax=Glycine max TaxID=3847 RepID=K7LGG5_SOYBN|nr:uncharacterized protein LOC102667802 isoform X1 [Glycine max]KAG5014226.1 hypothetical protein JHK86_026487 [Glycine max]KAH1235265.1 hypothetical protein GmHk_09G027253 [Glycine max]KRH40741.1 hypothetical protein GLYMA_09G275200v4 [Glycine max]|eukprot:XP_006587923.1 uncharacterized protein LOC102667802 isoform X1 [Glycine max]
MQSETEQQSWRLHVTAKANKFNFRLRFAAATHRYRPTWNLSFFRISILLKLPKFALIINSHPTNPTRGRGFFATKFTKILHRLRPRLPKKKESNAPCLKVNDPIRSGFWIMGILAFLAQRGIGMLASVGSLLLLFRKLKIAKLVNLVTFFLVVVGTIFYYLFDYNLDYSYNNYWQYMRRSWSKMVSL